MKILNKKVIKTFSGPFAHTYNSINDIKCRHNMNSIAITENKGNPEPIALPSPLPPHFPKKLIVSFFILLLLITPTKKNK